MNSVKQHTVALWESLFEKLQQKLSSLIALCKLRGWMCYSLRHCLYSKKACSDLSTVLPLTETTGGKPPHLAHSAHVLLSVAEQLNGAPSFPVSRALPNEARPAVSSPLQPGPHRRISRNMVTQSCTLNLFLICLCNLIWLLNLRPHSDCEQIWCHCGIIK